MSQPMSSTTFNKKEVLDYLNTVVGGRFFYMSWM